MLPSISSSNVAYSSLENDPVVILRAVHRELANSPYGCLKRLRCEWQASILRVTGSVPSYYLKQIAQSSIRRVARDCDLDNCIEVIEDPSKQGSADPTRSAAQE